MQKTRPSAKRPQDPGPARQSEKQCTCTYFNINENNSSLKSNYLLYNKLTKEAVTKDNVVYTNKHTKIYSDKLEYNTNNIENETFCILLHKFAE